MSVLTGGRTPSDHDQASDDRRAGRIALEVYVELQSGAGSCAGVTKNICAGGVFVATLRSFSVGERIARQSRDPRRRGAGRGAGRGFVWSRPFQELDDRPVGLGLQLHRHANPGSACRADHPCQSYILIQSTSALVGAEVGVRDQPRRRRWRPRSSAGWSRGVQQIGVGRQVRSSAIDEVLHASRAIRCRTGESRPRRDAQIHDLRILRGADRRRAAGDRRPQIDLGAGAGRSRELPRCSMSISFQLQFGYGV